MFVLFVSMYMFFVCICVAMYIFIPLRRTALTDY